MKQSFYHSPLMERLIKEERDFMRGKYDFPELLMESEEKLAFAGPYMVSDNNYEINVEILDRKSGDVLSFTVALPEQDQLGLMYIMGVQLLDDKLSVMAYNHYLENQQVRIYEIDVQEQEVTRSVLAAETGPSGYINNQVPYEDVKPKSFWVLDMGDSEWDDELMYEEITATELVAYELETGELIAVELPEEFTNADQGHQMSAGTDHIHFYKFSMGEIIMQSFDLNKEEYGQVQSIEFEESELEGLAGVYPYGDEVYFLVNGNWNGGDQTLYGIDLLQGNVHFTGNIQASDTADQSLTEYLSFYDLRLK